MSIKQDKMARKESRLQNVSKRTDQNAEDLVDVRLELQNLKLTCQFFAFASFGLAIATLFLDNIRGAVIGVPILSSRISTGVGMGQWVLVSVFALLGLILGAISRTRGKGQ